MKKSAVTSRLPISRKAYKGFVDRIKSLLGESDGAASLIAALDLYLGDDSRYAEGLDASLRLAFEFLRQEVDKAVERSRKARERAAQRKQAGDEEKDYIEFNSTGELLGKIYEMAGISKNEKGEYRPPLSRRDRRAFERMTRKEIIRDARRQSAKTR